MRGWLAWSVAARRWVRLESLTYDPGAGTTSHCRGESQRPDASHGADVGTPGLSFKETAHPTFRPSTTSGPRPADERADPDQPGAPHRCRGRAAGRRADLAGLRDGAGGRAGPRGDGPRRAAAGLQDPRLRQDALREFAEAEQGQQGPRAEAQGDPR